MVTVIMVAMEGTEDMVEAHLTGIGANPRMLFPLPILDK